MRGNSEIWIFVPQCHNVTSQAGFSQRGTTNLLVTLWKTSLGPFVLKSATMQQVKKCWLLFLGFAEAAGCFKRTRYNKEIASNVEKKKQNNIFYMAQLH